MVDGALKVIFTCWGLLGLLPGVGLAELWRLAAESQASAAWAGAANTPVRVIRAAIPTRVIRWVIPHLRSARGASLRRATQPRESSFVQAAAW